MSIALNVEMFEGLEFWPVCKFHNVLVKLCQHDFFEKIAVRYGYEGCGDDFYDFFFSNPKSFSTIDGFVSVFPLGEYVLLFDDREYCFMVGDKKILSRFINDMLLASRFCSAVFDEETFLLVKSK